MTPVTDFRESASAPSHLPLDRSANGMVPASIRNEKVNSASPVAQKLNQKNGGKSLPPLKKGPNLRKS